MTWVGLRDSFWSWVNAVLNGASGGSTPTIPPWGQIPAAFSGAVPVPIRWNYQGGPRPQVAYVGLKIIVKRSLGMPYEAPVYLKSPDYAANSGIMQALAEHEATLSAQGYGDGSDEYLEAIESSLHMPWWDAIINSYGLFKRDHEEIRDISMIIDETAERRYVFEATFGFPEVLQFAPAGGVPWVEFVDPSGTVTDPSGNNPISLSQQIGQ